MLTCLNKIDDELKGYIPCFESVAESIVVKLRNKKSTIVKFKMSDNEKEIRKQIDNIKEGQGIYFFEILIGNDITDKEKWIQEFTEKWDKKGLHIANVISKRIEKHANMDLGKWIPLYIGITKKIKSRIEDHIFLNADATTYSMKIVVHKNDLPNSEYRVKIYKFNLECYDIIAKSIEMKVRNIINPIVGKQ